MNCKVDKPYPKIMVEGKNFYYANLLLKDYSGAQGELTAITQYMYQLFNKFQQNKEFSNIIFKIAVVEMKHLDLLGKTINLLGIEPKYKFYNGNSYECWNSSFVNYSTNLVDILESNIKKEENAIKSYKLHMEIINDKYIKKLLYRIILDEYEHLKCFKALLKKQISFY